MLFRSCSSVLLSVLISGKVFGCGHQRPSAAYHRPGNLCAVPISNEIMNLTPDEDGNFSIDQHAVMMQAVLMGLDDDIQWTIEEEPRVDPHPEQIAPPTVC